MAGFGHLFHLADALGAQVGTADAGQLSFEDASKLIDRRSLWKENRARARRPQSDRLKECGVTEDID
jgi:hypothetical protein